MKRDKRARLATSDVVRVAIYARLSTTDQNCEMQLRQLREYVSRRGWLVADEYVDTGISGLKTSRPQLNRLKQDARERRFDVVTVWKLDRWGRSLDRNRRWESRRRNAKSIWKENV